MDELSLLKAALEKTDCVPVSFQEDGEFLPLFEAPEWLQSLKPWTLDNFPVLECALDGFLESWESGDVGEPFGPWEQSTESGETVALEVQALPASFGRVVLLKNLGAVYAERVQTLQKARDHLLVHEALQKEIKKKEFLLHTIVHDLAGPLTSIRGALHILGRGDLPKEQVDKLLEIGLRQTEKQNGMIREILDVFAAEVGSLEKLATDSHAEPLEVARGLQESLSTAFQAKGVKLQAEGTEVSVVGDTAKLERVLSNLIENALRHVPRGSTVWVSVTPEDEWGLVEVSDDGPGVSEEFAGQLFRKLAQGAKGKGKIGLGLYFCKLTVEAWGGTIGYKPSSQGGACFWFKLPRFRDEQVGRSPES